MDFLYSGNPNDASRLRETIQPFANNYPSKRVYVYRGNWGCLVATGSQYFRMEPCETDNTVVLISGDPLSLNGADLETIQDEPHARTSAYLRRWKLDPSGFAPHHPSAMISVCTDSGCVDVTTDAWGAVPVYATEEAGLLILGSSPDLIALVHPCQFDRISAAERLCSKQISFPNTLYSNVKELLPGAVTHFEDGKRTSTKWWTPPLPETDTLIDTWAQRLQRSIKDTISRIGKEVSKSSVLTLSAGYDTRFLLSIISEENLLKLNGVNLTALPSYKRAIARQIAAKYDIPIATLTRKVDHYSKILLNGHPEFGTNVCFADAHFGDIGLGKINNCRSIIGGFMADTLLIRGDPFTVEREGNIRKNIILPTAPRWAANSLFQKFNNSIQKEITQRWNSAESLLAIKPGHSPTISRVFPASRQGHKGHFDAARRSYPIYEPFMTVAALEIGFTLPDELKTHQDKKRFYGHYLDYTADIPVNPTHSRALKMLSKLAKRFYPLILLPESLTYSNEWSEIKSTYYKQAKGAKKESLKKLSGILEVNLSEINDNRILTNIVTIVQAHARCKDIPKPS